MTDILLYVLLGLACAMIIGLLVYKIVQFCKMPTEEKKKVLITYLKGLVAFAEAEIGSGHGAEKLALVEEYFKTKAPMVYKILLLATGKDNLKDLIEVALKEIKESFSK